MFCFFLKCVLTDQRIKAIEQVHGYFSSEQVCSNIKLFYVGVLKLLYVASDEPV